MGSRFRIILVSLVIVGAVSYLILTGVKQTGLNYMTVTELAQLRRPPPRRIAAGRRVGVGTVSYDRRSRASPSDHDARV